MKKIVIMAAAVAALAFTSCGGSKTSDPVAADTVSATETAATPEAAEAAAAEATAKLEEAITAGKDDPSKVKEVVAEIQKKVEELKASGDTEAAAAYASKIKQYLDEHADDIKNIDPSSLTVVDLVNAAANLPSSVKEAAQEGVEAVTGDASAAKDAAKAAAEQAKTAAKTAADEAVNKAKSDAEAAATKAKENVKAKADAAVQKGAQKASDALNKAFGK